MHDNDFYHNSAFTKENGLRTCISLCESIKAKNGAKSCVSNSELSLKIACLFIKKSSSLL